MHKLSEHRDWGLLILRIVLGAVFIAHGYQKLFVLGAGGVAGFFGAIGIPAAAFFAWVVSLVEFFGGIAILVGLVARYAALLLAINMLVALLVVHLPNGFFITQTAMGYEFVLTLFAALVFVLFNGAGKYSVELAWLKKEL